MQFGYYGKTIHRGDFVKFNLPQIFINVWDDWLQQVLHEGDVQHESDWNNIYLSSCSYRFGLSAGIAGESPWIGVMCPATDKVGRRFPFCIALSLPDGISPVAHSVALEPIYAGIQELVKQATQPEYEFDNLQSTMAEMSTSLKPDLEAFSSNSAHNFKPSDPSTNLSIRTNSHATLDDPVYASSLLDSVLRQTWFSYSIWQPVDRLDESQSSLISGGLPMISSALALFDAAWNASKTGSLILPKAQLDTAKAAVAAAAAQAADLQEAPADTSIDEDDSINADSTQPVPSSKTENEPLTDHEDVPLEFQKTEKVPPPTDTAAPDSLPELDQNASLLDDFEEPVVEKLELDDELADENPWDNK